MAPCIWKTLFFLFLSQLTHAYNFNESSFYAGLAGSLAKYFNSACIYFLTDSRNEDSIFLERVIKETTTKFNESTNIYSFEEYHQHHDDRRILQCYVPLQVVISHDEATRKAFALHSHRSEMHGSDSVGGGVWLVFLDSTRQQFIEEYFEGINTPFDVEIIVAELKQNDEMMLREVYRVRHDRPLRCPSFGIWSQKGGLRAPLKSLLYSRRSDLEQITLNVGYVESAPFSYNGTKDGRLHLQGYLGDIWETLEEVLNVTSNFTYMKDYGAHSEKGWSGLLKNTIIGNFDVGIADMSLTPKRFEVVSYSNPLLITSFQVYYQSSGSILEADALFMPLARDIWASLLGWILVSALFLYIGCYLSDRNFKTDEKLTLPSAVFFVAGALCAQGGVRIPKLFTCRVFFIASFLITTVVMPSYSASLMSFLAVLPPSIPFSNMQQFYEHGNIRMTLKWSSYEYDLFAYESTNDPYMNRIYKRDIAELPEEEFPRSNEKAIYDVCHNKNLAFFGLSDAVQWAIIREERIQGKKWTCSVANMPFDAGKVSVGMVFPKNSHFRGLINHHLSYLPSRGILRRLRYKHWPINKALKNEEHQAVGLHNLFMTFAILASGITLALIFFTIEVCLGRQKQKPSQVLCPEALANYLNHLHYDSVYYYY